MNAPLSVVADPSRARAIGALDDLLTRLKIDHAFVGGVARAAWLGESFEDGPVDVLALMATESKGQVPMMASNRGFEVDRDEVEAADELDLIPLKMAGEAGTLRCHVLIASNALYAQMVNRAVPAASGEREVRVVGAEDLALLLLVGEVAGAAALVDRIAAAAGEAFDRKRWQARLASIGLGSVVVS